MTLDKSTVSQAEIFAFGRARKAEERFGVYKRLAVAQASNKDVRSLCQDGGLVTTLLLVALKNGIIDGAIVSGINKEKPFWPVPRLVASPNEILECAGTRYFYSPNIAMLNEAARQKKASIAFVGTPCQIRAARKMQMSSMRSAVPVKFLIGLMCSECFTYEGLMEQHIQEKLGIKLDEIEKMNIKGKMILTTKSGTRTIPLSEIKQYARKNCCLCDDFSAELADVSAGGLGLEGWTFTIIRSEKGEELFGLAGKAGVVKTRDANEEKNALSLLQKLSEKKRKFSME